MTGRPLAHLWPDVRFGLRQLRRIPGLTAVAVVTLALGIGANTAIFSAAYAVLMRPLPYEDPDRLVIVWEQNLSRDWTTNIVSPANFLDWRRQNTVFTEMAAVDPTSFNLSAAANPSRSGASRSPRTSSGSSAWGDPRPRVRDCRRRARHPAGRGRELRPVAAPLRR